MSLEWKKCFLNVPLNSQGIEEHNSFTEEWNNVFTVELQKKNITSYQEETLEIANE
ncbi:MAG: hypothetical protein IIT39_09230 [Clostridia bacterium]|nr:hypothetical protein [Clostridia bacterium]